MTEPKTLPQNFSIPFVAAGNPVRDAWLVRTEALLGSFERRTAAQTREASPAGAALGFIVMASDYLWLELREGADFAKLDVAAFAGYCRELLSADDTRHSFVEVLVGFYEFLADTQHIEAEPARKIVQALHALLTASAK